MLRVGLAKMLVVLNRRLKERGERKIRYEDIHLATGIHKKILSRIVNQPEQNTSSEHIDKLAQFFFLEFRRLKDEGNDDRQLMCEIIANLVEVFPDPLVFRQSKDEGFWLDDDYPIPALWKEYQLTNNRDTTTEWWEKTRLLEQQEPPLSFKTGVGKTKEAHKEEHQLKNKSPGRPSKNK